MFITRESDYAVRIIRSLADGAKKSMGDISAGELVPVPFAYKILKKLEKGGLVQSFRGAGGGYRLTRAAAQITLFDVMIAVDGKLLLSECMDHNYRCPHREGGKQCKVHGEFERIQALILAGLRERTLDQIL
ncbi:MAG: Rrf2 family transcriptional regulator [Treponema sp.]|jgi:Rrf2 family protein|nr:Rrf2 family transcriptional regulator [Treponema sp.]